MGCKDGLVSNSFNKAFYAGRLKPRGVFHVPELKGFVVEGWHIGFVMERWHIGFVMEGWHIGFLT